MRIIDKYISNAENSKKPDSTKVVISDEAFAFVEVISDLTKTFRDVRGVK